MTVEELTSLRDSLRKAGGEYYVVKNTLARIAFTGGPHDVVKDKFHENCAIALGFDDPVAVAKALSLGQVLGTMNAVPTNFVSLFANIIRGMLYALKAIEEQKAKAA